jgi:hypothetical protein
MKNWSNTKWLFSLRQEHKQDNTQTKQA